MATATKNPADIIRAALKTAGYNARKVTVRHEHFSMGSSLYVKIRDNSVPKSAVIAIASSHEHVRRCETSGEILSGGNTYLHVDYTKEAIDPIANPIRDLLLATPEGVAVEIAGRRVARMKTWNGYGFQVCTVDGHEPRLTCYATETDVDSAALKLAEMQIEAATVAVDRESCGGCGTKHVPAAGVADAWVRDCDCDDDGGVS